MTKNSIAVLLAALVFFSPSVYGQEISEPDYSACILTPKAPETPRINGPKIYGARPGADFLFRIPATGRRPMTFSATGLPKGLKLDRKSGIISGKAVSEGEFKVSLKASNKLGSDVRELRIVIGDRIALTPPMGWNSWNCWGNSVSQDKIISSAKAMLDKGLADYGWSYVNIDDGWQGVRGGKDNAIMPNSKFPDMKGLVDYLHSNGLKAGIYSGPWVGTYAGHIGETCNDPDGKYFWIEEGICDSVYKVDRSRMDRGKVWHFGEYSFAAIDAAQWAEWGFDYLKYDWNPNDLHYLKEMHDALAATGRDIVYSISNSAPYALAPYLMRYAQCWRTTGDIRDKWSSIFKIGFGGMDGWAACKRPGNWPDADMLVLGKVGWGPKTHFSKLTPDEQYTHMTLWSILSSPLLVGCDLAALDDFTLSLLCNNEVIDVNQDPLGLQASRIYGDETYATYLKPLEDGSVAIALFNLSEKPKTIGFIPRSIGLPTRQTVRDLWRQKDIATVEFDERWETEVAPHGCAFVRLSPGITGEKLIGAIRMLKEKN